MPTKLTVRIDDEFQKALEKRARAMGKTVSELVRDLLESALAEEPISARAGHLKGRLALPKPEPGSLRERFIANNWRREG